MSYPAIAVFCSGQGTNFQAILQAIRHRPLADVASRRRGPRAYPRGSIRRRKLRARVAVMVTDNPSAGALEVARRFGIPTAVVERSRFPSRVAFEQALSREVDGAKARLVALAGFMRVLSPWFVGKYRGRILNIHPALLPAFPGAHGVRDALRHGVKVTGVTVHFADEEADHGPILLQEAVPVRTGETEESLLARLHRVEHRLYPAAIQLALDNRVRIQGRRVVFKDAK